MKKLLSFVFMGAVAVAFAQPGKKSKDPHMAAELVPGYYVTSKGDTVKGEIQTNPENVGEMYTQVNFKAPGAAKLTIITTKKAKAYGYGDNHFMMYAADGAEIYLRYLAKGRLNFMEFKYASSFAGAPIIAVDYFIQDSKADDANADLKQFKKLNEKFYKKEMKPYMKDQAMIWSDMDKFVFKPEVVANSVKEYNKMYE